MKFSNSKEILKSKNYLYEESIQPMNLCWLVKPLDNLEALVKELKDIAPILLNK